MGLPQGPAWCPLSHIRPRAAAPSPYFPSRPASLLPTWNTAMGSSSRLGRSRAAVLPPWLPWPPVPMVVPEPSSMSRRSTEERRPRVQATAEYSAQFQQQIWGKVRVKRLT